MSNCWLWDASRNGKGYGTTWRKPKYAHRLVYEALVGPIPEGLTIDHLCNNPGCVNPEHMEPVTALENYRRGPWSSPNRTHCPRGHEYDEANTKRIPSRPNARYCRECHRIGSRSRITVNGKRVYGGR
jgi:hypothetical protein